jgi:hypothetical protein
MYLVFDDPEILVKSLKSSIFSIFIVLRLYFSRLIQSVLSEPLGRSVSLTEVISDRANVQIH